MSSFILRTLLFSLPLSLVACGGDDDPAPSRDGAALSCADLATALHGRAMATSTSCSGASDCVAVGYPMRDDGGPTCNCGVTFSMSCGGDAVNRAAWEGDTTAAAMYADWLARCVPQGVASGAPDLCDCTTNGVTCSPAGTCVAQAFNCLSPGDAGVQ